MQRALGGGRAGYSRKRDIIKMIMLTRSFGMSFDAVQASVKGYNRKTLAQLREISQKEYAEYQAVKTGN